MPRNETHKEYTFWKLSVSGWDIHKWMDELWLRYGKSHRDYRHDPWTWIPFRFVYKYGLELVIEPSKLKGVDHSPLLSKNSKVKVNWFDVESLVKAL